MNKSAVTKSEQRRKAHKLLTSRKYRLQTAVHGPNSLLEFYAGPKGSVILQTWPDGNGVTVFADWPLGVTWGEIEKALEPPPEPPRRAKLKPPEGFTLLTDAEAMQIWRLVVMKGRSHIKSSMLNKWNSLIITVDTQSYDYAIPTDIYRDIKKGEVSE